MSISQNKYKISGSGSEGGGITGPEWDLLPLKILFMASCHAPQVKRLGGGRTRTFRCKRSHSSSQRIWEALILDYLLENKLEFFLKTI